MTFIEFANKYNGKFLDFDGRYGYQCMDLMRAYIQEVLRLPPYTLPAVTYAKQVFTNFKPNKYFTKVINTPTAVPKKGDIIFWGWKYPTTGVAGHVAIFSEGNVNCFISFDQNYPSRQPCKYVNHSYSGVLGWLSPKK